MEKKDSIEQLKAENAALRKIIAPPPPPTAPPPVQYDASVLAAYRAERAERQDLSNKLTYFIVGSTIGAVVALMFAPKSGRELRGDIADATRKGVDKSRETAAQIGEKAGEYYEVTKDRAGELYATAATKAGEVARGRGEQLQAAIEAGKQAYTEEKRRTMIDTDELDAPIFHGNPGGRLS